MPPRRSHPAMLQVAAISVLLAAAPLEQRYQAPMEGEGYRVRVEAPQLVTVGRKATARIIVEAVGDAKLNVRAKPVVEWTLSKGRLKPRQREKSAKRRVLELPVKLARPGTHEMVIGVEVRLEGRKAPVRVAVPWSITAEPEL